MGIKKEIPLGEKFLSIEVGKVARQADASAWVKYGDNVVLVSVVAEKEIKELRNFMPLSVDYREKAYSMGRIPGGFFKREGKPSEKEVLSSRLIDRPIRPLFPRDFFNDTQIMVFVLSSDQEYDVDFLGIIGASAALSVSDIPFDGPIGAVKIGKIGSKYILNPTFSQLDKSSIDMIVAASEESIIMVEGESKEISNEEMIDAIKFAHSEIRKIIPFQNELREKAGIEKRKVEPLPFFNEIFEAVKEKATESINIAIHTPGKAERNRKFKEILDNLNVELQEKFPDSEVVIERALEELTKNLMRKMVIEENVRADGRNVADIRDISIEISLLPRTHGSALFTRGETQALAVTTLGTKIDEQKIEGLEGDFWKSYMLHYNFPPFSVGEVKPIRGPGRREIGHGHLAERSLKAVIPAEEEFPYTIRIVSDILESNGSSSMATVCAGSLSLMDAGVPTKKSVAGIAMGLIKENENVSILSDILGIEDHLGDMDFKVAGTRDGITGFQMDIKIPGISYEILSDALQKAEEGRNRILDIMDSKISKPRPYISKYAPKIIAFKIEPTEIGTVIGTGGKIIRDIQEKTSSTISIEPDGTVFISSFNKKDGEDAKKMIDSILAVPEVGKVYKGKVKKIANFGAFVEFLPGKEGLLHISEIDHRRINRVEDVLKVGDEVEVKIKRIDAEGRVDLTRKVLLKRR